MAGLSIRNDSHDQCNRLRGGAPFRLSITGATSFPRVMVYAIDAKSTSSDAASTLYYRVKYAQIVKFNYRYFIHFHPKQCFLDDFGSFRKFHISTFAFLMYNTNRKSARMKTADSISHGPNGLYWHSECLLTTGLCAQESKWAPTNSHRT